MEARHRGVLRERVTNQIPAYAGLGKADAPLKAPTVCLSKPVDPQYPAEYIKEIVENLRATEAQHLPNPNFLHMQDEIQERHRAILIDWLVGNHNKLKMHPETLYLAINIIDRYLSKKKVLKAKLQLVGAVALLIAAKYEEMYPPSVRRIVYLCANTYTREDVLRCERAILNELEFALTVPTPFHFLRRALQVSNTDTRTTQPAAYYLSELALLEYTLLKYTPSVLAAGCVYAANRLTGVADPWDASMVHYTRLSPEDKRLRACAADLIRMVRAPSFPQCQNVQGKYAKAHPAADIAKLPLRAEVLCETDATCNAL